VSNPGLRIRAEAVEEPSPLGHLRPCKHCGHRVAHNAYRCPRCDGQNPYPLLWAEVKECLIAFGVLFVLIILVTMVVSIGKNH